MILFYKNSFLASVVSIFASAMVIGGISCLIDGEIGPGILLIAAAIPFLILAKWISNNKSFKKWWKQVEDANLTAEIAASTATAKAIYQKNPQKRTLNAIRKLNPAAAAAIEGKPLPAAAQTPPAKKTPPQPAPAPRQENREAPPRSAAPRQEAPQAAPRSQPVPNPAPQTGVDAQLQQIIRTVNGNKEHQSDLYLQCSRQLEELHAAHPEHAGITAALAQTYALFGHHVKEYTFENRKKAVESLLRALELEPGAPQQKLEQRIHMLYLHSVMASISAGNSKGTRQQMIEAREMLRLAALYHVPQSDPKAAALRDTALPVARCRIAWRLANDLWKGTPPQPRQAAAMIEEALRFCPMESMRQCDINPYTPDNQGVILTRQQLLETKAAISRINV